MVTVYAQVTKEMMSEMRAFLRANDFERPKLGRLPVQVQPHRPYITFTFQDDLEATLLKFRFPTLKLVQPETVAEIDAEERERFEEGVRRLNPPPDIQEVWRRNLIALGTLRATTDPAPLLDRENR